MKILLGIPVYNEESYLYKSLEELVRFTSSNINEHEFDFLVADDGSTDNTYKEFERFSRARPDENLMYIKHQTNLGYGHALISIFQYAKDNRYDYVITFDADLQHDPATIPIILEHASNGYHFVSASRYLDPKMIMTPDTIPYDRYLINMMITRLFNEVFEIYLTDSFCGFKGYRVSKIDHFLNLKERGYAMPLELLLVAKKYEMKFIEVSTPCIYLDNRRARKDWKERINNYAQALEKFSWTSNQKAKVQDELAKIMEMLDVILSERKKEETTINIKPFNDFWQETIDLWTINGDKKTHDDSNCHCHCCQ